jgi:hypothetical protein
LTAGERTIEKDWKTPYVRGEIARYCGFGECEKATSAAGSILDGLLKKYSGYKGKDRKIICSTILYSVSFYTALKNDGYGRNAGEIIYSGLNNAAEVFGSRERFKFFLPFGRLIYTKKLRRRFQHMISKDTGFVSDYHKEDDGTGVVEIKSCPYIELSASLGCPDLADAFCNMDRKMYPDIGMTDVEWIRSGGSSCTLRIEKRSGKEVPAELG